MSYGWTLLASGVNGLSHSAAMCDVVIGGIKITTHTHPIPMYHLSEILNGIDKQTQTTPLMIYEQVLLSRKMSHFWFELMLMPHDTP